MAEIIFLTGSNIEPVANTRDAIRLLRSSFPHLITLRAFSAPWETKAVGSAGPDFINMAVSAESYLSPELLKDVIFRPLEAIMGRIRTGDKNAPRTIDLDLITYNLQVIESNLWKRGHIAAPVSELLPALIDPVSGRSLYETAQKLCDPLAICRRDDLISAICPASRDELRG